MRQGPGKFDKEKQSKTHFEGKVWPVYAHPDQIHQMNENSVKLWDCADYMNSRRGSEQHHYITLKQKVNAVAAPPEGRGLVTKMGGKSLAPTKIPLCFQSGTKEACSQVYVGN